MKPSKLSLLLLLAACELQPAPRKQAEPAPAPEARAPVAAPTPPSLPQGSGAGSAQAKLEVTPACVEVGSHVADVYIASAKDPAQKSVYEQEKTRMIRATAEACTTQAWPEKAIACYKAAPTPLGIKACEEKFPPRPVVRNPGVGSAAPVPVAPPPAAGSGMRPEPLKK